MGAVLVNDCGEKQRFFSEQVSTSFLGRVNVAKRKTLIFECDFFRGPAFITCVGTDHQWLQSCDTH